MKAAIVGSRSLEPELPAELIGTDYTQIISGGARGIDRSARHYAEKHHIQILEILPEYELYGRSAPLKRNDWIISLSDIVFIFWDGKSRGSDYMIKNCKKQGKPMKLYQHIEGKFVLIEEIPLLPSLPDTLLKNFVPTIIYE